MTRVLLKRGRARPFFYRHPWVFSRGIQRIDGVYKNGDEVEVYDHNTTFIGRGFINDHSQIQVRLLSWEVGDRLDRSFFRQKLLTAQRRREQIGVTCDNAYRLVNSEGDSLSGLVVDFYNGLLVLQCLSLGFYLRRKLIAELLQELFPMSRIYMRMDKEIAKFEAMPFEQEFLAGDSDAEELQEMTEGGIRFLVDYKNGHKTGFYLDQKKNRLALASLVDGRRVLDVFSYTGAFAFHAAKGGAESVVSIESSAPAQELAKKNMSLNGLDNILFQKADAFTALQDFYTGKELFDVVILDPPKLLRTPRDLHNAFNAYKRINQLALSLVRPGGQLITCSCSQLFSEENFCRMLTEAAVETKRNVSLVKVGLQSPDHVMTPFCPEGKYLKTFFTIVE